jgi:hypothetical protein
MPQDRDINISRKFSKQRQRNISLQQDFVAQLSARLILQRMLDSTAVQSQNIERALHLYSRGNETSSLLHDAVECIDQLPFKRIQTSITRTMAMLPAKQYDIVFSNLVFDWLNAGAFIRMQDYLLKPEGMFWFSCYGPSTALRSRSIMSEIDTFPHFNEFYDLRDVGDALLGAGFKDVVLESSITHLEYDSVNAVMADAVRVFGVNAHPQRRKSMAPSGVLKQFKLRIEEEIRSEGKFTEQVEILIAHGKKSSTPGMGGAIPVRQA